METKELTPQDFDNVVNIFGQKIVKFDMLKFEKNNCNLGAFDKDRLIGIITAQPRKLIKPLDAYTDLFIAYIEVLKPYQKPRHCHKIDSKGGKFCKTKRVFPNHCLER